MGVEEVSVNSLPSGCSLPWILPGRLQTYADGQDVSTVRIKSFPPSRELQMASSHAKGSLPLLLTGFLTWRGWGGRLLPVRHYAAVTRSTTRSTQLGV